MADSHRANHLAVADDGVLLACQAFLLWSVGLTQDIRPIVVTVEAARSHASKTGPGTFVLFRLDISGLQELSCR
jgi:hypothetical protein